MGSCTSSRYFRSAKYNFMHIGLIYACVIILTAIQEGSPRIITVLVYLYHREVQNVKLYRGGVISEDLPSCQPPENQFVAVATLPLKRVD